MIYCSLFYSFVRVCDIFIKICMNLLFDQSGARYRLALIGRYVDSSFKASILIHEKTVNKYKHCQLIPIKSLIATSGPTIKAKYQINMFVLLLLLTVSVTRSEYVDVINVGTTLFSDADNAMKCWSKESIALLASRKIFQDALPSEKFSVVPNDDYVDQFVKYFQILVQDVKKISYGKSQHILMLALADVLGGYLNHYLLPTAKYAHYFGYLKYDSVKRLYNVFYELRAFLNTDGVGWKSPRNMTDSLSMFSPQPLPVIDIENENETCQQLVFSRKNAGRKTVPRDAATIVIPMPFFDSKTTPSAIAVPFRTHSLRNIQSRSSSNILLKYYILSTKCLHSQKNAAINTLNYNRKLYAWISTEDPRTVTNILESIM